MYELHPCPTCRTLLPYSVPYSATSVIGMKLGASLAGCLDMLTGPGSQPGAYVMASFQGSLVEAWSSRLGLEADVG